MNKSPHNSAPVYTVDADRLIRRDGKDFVVIIRCEPTPPEDVDAFCHTIFRAVNAHEALIRAAKDAAAYMRDRAHNGVEIQDCWQWVEFLEAAIAKAEGR